MFTPVSYEAFGFLLMCALGAALGAVYHIVVIVRESLFSSRAAVIISDILISSVCAFAVASALLYYNFALIRWYLILGLIIGAVLYFLTIGRLFFIIFSLFWKYFLKILVLILKILLTPVLFLHKIIMIPLKMAGKLLHSLKAAALKGFRSIVNGTKKHVQRHRKKEDAGRKEKRLLSQHSGNRSRVRGGLSDNDSKRRSGAASDKRQQKQNR